MLDFITETENSWDFLKRTELPVFIFGMGDGALKIMAVMEERGIPVAGFFASDDFVRGHSFAEHRVHSLSEIESFLDDFVIVLAFAAGYPALVEKINEIASRHTLLAPDVPVAGDGVFTYQYCLEHAEELQKVYDLLADAQSKQVFADVINFRISGKIGYLNGCTSPKGDVFVDILKLSSIETYVDLGAYDGDTVVEFCEQVMDSYNEIYAVEPDRRNFRKLKKTIEGKKRVTAVNAAAWSCDTTLYFTDKAGRQSAVAENGKYSVDARSVDSILCGEPCTLLKMDVEGAEKQAIAGAENTIKKYAPRLMISLYHRNEDIFELPLMINGLRPDYKLYIRHQLYIPAWETNLYCTI